MAKFTLNEFKKHYQNDDQCLEKIFKLRFGHHTHCPECSQPAAWRRVRGRRCHQCRHCYAQFYATAGTVFHNSRRPLTEYFTLIFLFTTTRHGVSAAEASRMLGIPYKTAFAMCHRIRTLIGKIGYEKLKGFVEIDESYYSHGNKDGKTGRTAHNQSPVLGMVERTGDVKAFALNNVSKAVVFHLIQKHVDKDAFVSTDEFMLYRNINRDLQMQHGAVHHQIKEYRRGSISTNTIEGFFGQLRRMIEGCHIQVSHKYLQKYVGECVFRYNNRNNQHGMFELILTHFPLFEEVN